MTEANTTTDDATIRRWAERRGGKPAMVRGTEDRGGEGDSSFDFAEPDDKLEKIC